MRGPAKGGGTLLRFRRLWRPGRALAHACMLEASVALRCDAAALSAGAAHALCAVRRSVVAHMRVVLAARAAHVLEGAAGARAAARLKVEVTADVGRARDPLEWGLDAAIGWGVCELEGWSASLVDVLAFVLVHA